MLPGVPGRRRQAEAVQQLAAGQGCLVAGLFSNACLCFPSGERGAENHPAQESGRAGRQRHPPPGGWRWSGAVPRPREGARRCGGVRGVWEGKARLRNLWQCLPQPSIPAWGCDSLPGGRPVMGGGDPGVLQHLCVHGLSVIFLGAQISCFEN